MQYPRQTFTRDQFETHPLLSRLLQLAQVPEKIIIEGILPEVTIDAQGRALPRILTVVGSRRHSVYGKDAIKYLLESLAGHPVVIVSGLALGLDALAHKHALENKLVTISIPGSGLGKDVLYPRTNAHLKEQIINQGGALMSEWDDSMRAAKWTFLARNRIMAALSDAVLLIEADTASGTLVTARHALELGRDIGVIPGSIFSPTSTGTHALLRDGATPIMHTDDLFSLLHLSQQKTLFKEDEEKSLETFSEEERKLYILLSEPRGKDTLLMLSGLPPATFMVALTTLEMKGYIRETFGELRRVV